MTDHLLGPTWLTAYAPTLWTIAAMAGMLLVQVLLADVVGILRKHTPGTPVEGGHGNLLFRLSRAHANTNETLTAFGLLAVLGVLIGAPPAWLNGLCLVYLAGRVGHMGCYYLGWGVLRSVAFGVSLLGLLGLLGVVLGALVAVGS